jgi:hypothetical protein
MNFRLTDLLITAATLVILGWLISRLAVFIATRCSTG